jgi:hypothetical protein
MMRSIVFAIGLLALGAAQGRVVERDGWSIDVPDCAKNIEAVAANPLYSEAERAELARDRSLIKKPDYWNLPAHIAIDLSACYGAAGYSDVALRVIPAAEYRTIYSADGRPDPYHEQQFGRLRQWIDARGAVDTRRWPMLPFLDMSPMFTLFPERVEFGGGRGVRVVTEFTADVGFAESRAIDYVFQGLTDDSRYFVLLSVPLEASGLAAPDAKTHLGFDLDRLDRSVEAQRAYEKALGAMLARQNALRRRLAELDGIVRSIRAP